ncbi:MAG: hypothetical protein ABR582_15610 [Gemmatimonadaceae bacterium]
MNQLFLCLALIAIVACRSSEPGNHTTTTKRSSDLASDSTASHVAPRSADASSGVSLNDNAAEAASVVRQYYSAIAARDYESAYALWEQSGRASGKTLADFAAGFAHTTRVGVTINGTPQMGAAAGSQYVTVPVVVDAVQTDGQKQRFTGTYIVRRAMVDGATPEQRSWHIYSADLNPF